MRPAILAIALLIAIIHEIGGLPLSSESALWHKITRRDTAAALGEKKNNTSQSSTNEKESKPVLSEDKTSPGNGDELVETVPSAMADTEQSHNADESDSSSERSIDWQLLSGNPAELERELEYRRRRRSIRSSSLSRQHRIRTAGRVQRSRSKRNAYYNVVDPDLLAAYDYLQSRREDQEGDDEQPQVSLLDDVSDRDLSNLASLIYELQSADDGSESPILDDGDEEDQQLPGGYVDQEPTNDFEPEIRISPEQLAALEQVLSAQQEDDDGLYPKDKRSIDSLVDDDSYDDQEDNDAGQVMEPAYMIPNDIEPSYVQVPLADTYENPYDFYQTDEDPNLYEEALRRFDEEQLRQRIASLIEDINDQRQIARRRRR